MSSISPSDGPEAVAESQERAAVFQAAAPTIPVLPKITKSLGGGFRLSQRIAGDFVALADLAAVGSSAAFVMWLTHVNQLTTASQARDLLLIAPAVALVGMLALRAAGLHEMRNIIQVSRQSSRLLLVWATVSALAACILITFYGGPPLVLLAWLCLTPATLLSARSVLALAFRTLLDRGPLARRVALIGAGQSLARAAELVSGDRLTHLSAIFELPPESEEEALTKRIGEIIDTLAAGGFDDAIALVPSTDNHGIGTLIDHLGMLPMRIALMPVVALQTLDRIDPGDTDALSVTVAEKPVRGWSIVAKTVFDYLVAIAMLGVFAIPMLAIIIAIRLESPGPAIFRQHRTGLGGRVFRIWKFRSMFVLEDGTKIAQAQKEDERVTRVGRILRRLSLDELPQIFNVLAGEMSVVGPRPHARAHDAYYARLISDYRFRFRVKPGITGLAQIHGCRGETKTIDDMALRVGFDIEYASGYSLWRDIYVVAMTPFFGVLSSNSY